MIVFKDFSKASDFGDFTFARHILVNYNDVDTSTLEMHLILDAVSNIDVYNKHFHLTTLANLNPPFVINTNMKWDEYYPIFWIAEYMKDDFSDITFTANKLPNYYEKDHNTFFITIKKDKHFERYEEYLLQMMLGLNVIKCNLFYQETE